MIYVDSHVHIYNNFISNNLFDVISKNFERVESINNEDKRVLFLTQSDIENSFENLLKHNSLGNWKLSTKNNNCLFVESPLKRIIIILKCKQLCTLENLEVLSIGNMDTPNLLSLEHTVELILQNGGIPIIPWGFGKWWGKRGKILNNFLTRTKSTNFFLGDNGGRPGLLPYPVQFKIAAERGIFILPGSDPLPLKQEHKRIATYGFIISEKLDLGDPYISILNSLRCLTKSPASFGSLSSTSDFLKRQSLLRINKYQKNTSAKKSIRVN